LAGEHDRAIVRGAGSIRRVEDCGDDEGADHPEKEDQSRVAPPLLAALPGVIAILAFIIKQ